MTNDNESMCLHAVFDVKLQWCTRTCFHFSYDLFDIYVVDWICGSDVADWANCLWFYGKFIHQMRFREKWLWSNATSNRLWINEMKQFYHTACTMAAIVGFVWPIKNHDGLINNHSLIGTFDDISFEQNYQIKKYKLFLFENVLSIFIA